MNKLFYKIIARTILEVLWENKTSHMMTGDLVRAVQLRLGRTPDRDRNLGGGEVNHVLQVLVNEGRIEARRLKDSELHWSGCMKPPLPPTIYAYNLPLLDQLAAFAPEV